MSEQRQILEQYLRDKFHDKPALTVVRFEKIADGWESDNHIVTVEYGEAHRTREDWVWRIYSGSGSQAKAEREFRAMRKLFTVGYPVPQVLLLETGCSLVGRPFIFMEYFQGAVMWNMIAGADTDQRAQLVDQFCQLFVRLHNLDWRRFDESLLQNDPFLYIDRWLDVARSTLKKFPEIEVSPFLEWVTVQRTSLACVCPSPVHQDFHPGNILIGADERTVVIDWTNFDVTDPRFDLAWTLVLAYAYGGPELRGKILQGYQLHAREPAEQIEAFEAIACARRLFDLTVSLTQGAQHMGMNAQAVEAMRTNMEAHRRVYRLFIERTGLQMDVFNNLFG